MKMKKIISLFLTTVFSFVLFGSEVCLANSKEIMVRVMTDITSENISHKDNIPAELVSDIYINSKTKFKKGDSVYLIPTKIEKRGLAGKGGYIEIRRGFIKDQNGKEYPILLHQRIKGDDKDWVVVCMGLSITIILLPMLLFGLVKGNSAIIEDGTVFECTLSE